MDNVIRKLFMPYRNTKMAAEMTRSCLKATDFATRRSTVAMATVNSIPAVNWRVIVAKRAPPTNTKENIKIMMGRIWKPALV